MAGKELEVVEATVVEAPEPLSEGKAKVLDKRIRQACNRVNAESGDLLDLIEQAFVGQIHVALGMSWKEWHTDAVNISPANAAERKAIVSMMAGKGYSQQQMAELTGVNQATISRDLQGDENASTGVTIGSDGKTYPRERKQKPLDVEEVDPPEEPRKATDVIDDFRENMQYLEPAVQAFTDLLADDAELFAKARKRIAKSHLNPLTSMIADLSKVVDELMEP